jgi:hypothetical protein
VLEYNGLRVYGDEDSCNSPVRPSAWTPPSAPRPGAAAAIDAQFQAIPDRVETTIPGLESLRSGAPDLLAAQSSAMASVFVYDTGQEARNTCDRRRIAPSADGKSH